VRRAGGARRRLSPAADRARHRVAVCEQVEDPAEAKKRGGKSVVRRDVVRLVTPGTITEERLLDPAGPIICWRIARRGPAETAWCSAWIDISTGEFRLSRNGRRTRLRPRSRIEPREILVPMRMYDDPELSQPGARPAVTPLSRDGSTAPRPNGGCDYFGVATLDAFGVFAAESHGRGSALSPMSKDPDRRSRPLLNPPERETSAARRWPSMRRPAPISN
jgi:DNA mismatch repair protein MutS